MGKTRIGDAIQILLILAGMAFSQGCSTEGPRIESKNPESVIHVGGAVLHPGDIPCAPDKKKTLLQVLAEAGGVTDDGMRSRVLVAIGGTKISYNTKLIKAGEVEDPIIPCGAIVNVVRRLPL